MRRRRSGGCDGSRDQHAPLKTPWKRQVADEQLAHWGRTPGASRHSGQERTGSVADHPVSSASLARAASMAPSRLVKLVSREVVEKRDRGRG